jgi:hypothetical protein
VISDAGMGRPVRELACVLATPHCQHQGKLSCSFTVVSCLISLTYDTLITVSPQVKLSDWGWFWSRKVRV